MDYLESKGVVHRDLAARNILLSKHKRAKIADFGLSFEVKGEINLTEDKFDNFRRRKVMMLQSSLSYGLLRRYWLASEGEGTRNSSATCLMFGHLVRAKDKTYTSDWDWDMGLGTWDLN